MKDDGGLKRVEIHFHEKLRLSGELKLCLSPRDAHSAKFKRFREVLEREYVRFSINE